MVIVGLMRSCLTVRTLLDGPPGNCAMKVALSFCKKTQYDD